MKTYTLPRLRSLVKENNLTEELLAKYEVKAIKNCSKKQILDFLQEKNINTEMQEDDIKSNYSISDLKKNIGEDGEYTINFDDIINKSNIEIEQETNIELKNQKLEALNTIEKYYDIHPWLKNERIDIRSDPIYALKIVESKISSRSIQQLISSNFFVVMDGVEKLAVDIPSVNKYVKLQGFTENLKNHKCTIEIINELMVKYGPSISDGSSIGPEWRLLILLLTCGFQTHQNNLINEKLKEIKNKEYKGPINKDL